MNVEENELQRQFLGDADSFRTGRRLGDGVSLGFKQLSGAGAEIGDMEFIQFHPTALYLKDAPRFLLSEALRGEGAYLRNAELNRFMPKYHPLGELAPRDIVARAIVHELEISPSKDPVVYMDLTHLDSKKMRLRFPRIYATCMQYNVDMTSEFIPVRPAAHYAMGGVRTDLDGRTSLPGLYAAGEAAATGVHGANRLASNSLLEGLVFGARAGRTMREELRSRSVKSVSQAGKATTESPADTSAEQTIQHIQDLMWKDAGIVRTGTGLRNAILRLGDLRAQTMKPQTRRGHEAQNLLAAGMLVARSALAREESRGAHYRTDFPDHNDTKFLKHSIIEGDSIRFA